MSTRRVRVVECCVSRSEVTRLGDGVDSAGHLSQQAIQRTCAVLADYRQRDRSARAVDANLAVLTSAVRDASNGAEFHRARAQAISGSTPGYFQATKRRSSHSSAR